MKVFDNSSGNTSSRLSYRNRRGDYKFNRSLLYEVLLKDPALRTESDVKDLRLILEEIDFIKNHEL